MTMSRAIAVGSVIPDPTNEITVRYPSSGMNIYCVTTPARMAPLFFTCSRRCLTSTVADMPKTKMKSNVEDMTCARTRNHSLSATVSNRRNAIVFMGRSSSSRTPPSPNSDTGMQNAECDSEDIYDDDEHLPRRQELIG